VRPWDSVRIEDDGEALVPLEAGPFSLEVPHPYVALGAPYGQWGPWFLRRAVHERLLEAQRGLQARHAGWRLHLLDAWRPLAVQAFMVAHTDQLLRRTAPDLDDDARRARVLCYWAPPSEDPATPPPHSTGAAVDLTLVDAWGHVVDMGSPFDEPTERSHPDHFATTTDGAAKAAHAHRQLLGAVLREAGFARHPQEWWHFSHGDRAWAREADLAVARYGRTEPTRAPASSHVGEARPVPRK
jgi:D-alanyl-D-alanine dipeptidase